MSDAMALDPLERSIIDHLQGGFPVCSHPYAVAAARLGMQESELIARIKNLLQRGVLTRFGPLFQVERVGGAITAVGQTTSEGLEDLGNLSLPPLPDMPELPSADELRKGLATALEGAAHFLEVSPYQYGIGSRRGEVAWLTPAQALRDRKSVV